MQSNQNQNPGNNDDDDNRGPSVPEDKFKGRCIDAKMGFSKDKGTEYVSCQIEIVEGPHQGKLLKWDGWFSDAAAERTIKSMRYLGWQGNDFGNLSSMMAGKAVALVTVEHEESIKNGVTRVYAKIAWVNSLGVHMDKPMNAADIGKFNQRFQALAAKLGGTPVAGNQKPPSGNGGSQRPPQGGPPGEDAPPWGDDDAPPQRTRYGR